MIPTGSNQEIRGLAPSCIVFLPRICCKMHISEYRVRFLANARVRTMITRVETRFSLSSRLLGDMVLQVLQDTRSKKGNISGAKKVTWKLSFLRLFFQYFFFFLFFFRRTPSSILCIYSYKKENIPEQGKKFFPLKMKIRVYISNEPAYSLNKIFGKIILRIVRLIRCLMIKLSTIRVSLDILFIVHFEEKNDSNIFPCIKQLGSIVFPIVSIPFP